MKICADGYMKVGTSKVAVRTPGDYESNVEPVPTKDAIAFLLSHTFPGSRRVCRALKPRDCQMLRRAMWADSVAERMALVDRVWRSITEPVAVRGVQERRLLQVVQWKNEWAYPLYLERGTTRVIPGGGVPPGELNGAGKAPRMKFES